MPYAHAPSFSMIRLPVSSTRDREAGVDDGGRVELLDDRRARERAPAGSA